MIRGADAQRDAAACAAIYAPYVEDGPTSFEERAPDALELADRIEGSHVWLVAEEAGDIVGFAYACPHRSRPAYRWSVDVSVYVAAARAKATAAVCTRPSSRICVGAASGSPARASPCPTRQASPSMRGSASSR
jgi:L-amino acid N-acyltransferase YncA